MEVIYLSWKRNEEDLELINNTIWPYLKCWQAINVFFLIQDDEHKEGIPLTEEDPQEDEDLNEVNVNQSKQYTLSTTGKQTKTSF